MHTEVLQYYRVEFTADEYRLVTLALALKLKETEDLRAAYELNTKMCHQRALVLSKQLDVATKALQHAELIENPNIPPHEKVK